MRQLESLVGKRFGFLVVTEQAPSTPSGKRRWVCLCDCGTVCQAVGYDLTRGRKTSCGCRGHRDLTGQKIGRLTVLGRSEKLGSRGARQTKLWRCLCDCGEITYKATDTLTNPAVSMCKTCSARYGIGKAREKAGYLDGTQLPKIQAVSRDSDNAAGARGVYFESKTGRYRARIKFRGKLYNLGSFTNLEDAIKAREEGEERIFGKFLEDPSAMD